MYGHTTITAALARKNQNKHFHGSYTLSQLDLLKILCKK